MRDEVLKRLPVEGYWLYGEYDFIAKVELETEEDLLTFEKRIHEILCPGRFKLMPVKLSGTGKPRFQAQTLPVEKEEVDAKL